VLTVYLSMYVAPSHVIGMITWSHAGGTMKGSCLDKMHVMFENEFLPLRGQWQI